MGAGYRSASSCSVKDCDRLFQVFALYPKRRYLRSYVYVAVPISPLNKNHSLFGTDFSLHYFGQFFQASGRRSILERFCDVQAPDD
jgi:hypothetical protein